MTDLIGEVAQRYGFRVGDDVGRLSGGYENDVYRIATSHGRFAVRVCAPWIGSERVADEHAVLAFMSARIPQVHPAVPATDGSTWFVHDDRVVSVFPFVQGRRASRDDDEMRMRCAALLAQIHAAGVDYAGEFSLAPMATLDEKRNHYWDLDHVHAAVAGLTDSYPAAATEFTQARIEGELEWMRKRLDDLTSRGVVHGVVQGDFWPGNVLTTAGRITGVLDWLECRRDALVLELGRAIWEFCSDRDDHTLLRDRAKQFLDAYVASDGPVAENELESLVDAMRIGIVCEILRDFTHEKAEEAAAYHLGSLRRLAHLEGAEPL